MSCVLFESVKSFRGGIGTFAGQGGMQNDDTIYSMYKMLR